MNSEKLQVTIKTAYTLRQPLFIWGAPGIGKSDNVRQAAADMGVSLIDMRLSLLTEVDLRGIPSPTADGTTAWLPPAFLPREGNGILFLDEMNLGQPSVLAAAYQLILDRRLGEYTLPDGWLCLAAGNRETDRSNVTRMPAALAARFRHVDLDVELNPWVMWALDHGVSPETVAFLRFRPDLLHSFDPRRQGDERAHPNPRSWTAYDAWLQRPELEDSHLAEIGAGTVGQAAATERMAFRRLFRDLPSIDSILLNPAAAPVPTNTGTLYALCGALAHKASDNNIDRLMAYLARLGSEWQVITVRDAARRQPSICQTASFIRWAAAHPEII